jgi:VWFA-related protein
MTVGLDLARHAAEQFVLRLGPGDRARVGSFSDKLAFSGGLTADRDELLRHIRQGLQIGNPTRLFDAFDEAVRALASEPGRRVILLLSDGCDTASDRLWTEVRDRVRAEGVVLYTVEVRSPMRILPEFQRKRGWTCAELESQFMKAPTVGDLLRMNDPRRDQSGGYVLNELTLDTGGSRIRLLPTDDANATFTQMMDELHHIYLIGFSPPVLDGEYHELQVRVADRSLFVRARRGYTAAPAPAR